MMPYLDSLLARTIGAADARRTVAPRPVSLFEPASPGAAEPAAADDIGGDVSAGEPRRPEDVSAPAPRGPNAPEAPAVEAPPRRGADASASPGPDPRPPVVGSALVRAPRHPSTGDTPPAAAGDAPVQDAPAARRGRRDSAALPDIGRAADSADAATRDVRTQPGPNAAAAGPVPASGVAARAQPGRAAPHPSTGAIAPRAASREPVQEASAGRAAASAARITADRPIAPPRGAAYSQPDRPQLRPRPDAAAEIAGGRAAATPSPPAASQPEARLPEAQPPVIRVTIGRVEVRAVLPPPAEPPRSQPQPGPSLSLDDYLKRGRGGA